MSTIPRPYGKYSKDNPPRNCLVCEFHDRQYSPTVGYHMYCYDRCAYLNYYFAKLHIILRGEFRSLAKHDEDDLTNGELPYECPFFDVQKIFWELPAIQKMNREVFVYECAVHYWDYKGAYVYCFPETIEYLKNEFRDEFPLHYYPVKDKDKDWFIGEYGDEEEVLISKTNPDTWHYVPPQPI